MKARFPIFCAPCIVAFSIAMNSIAAQPIDIREFVQTRYFEGLSYEDASKFDSSVVPVLLEMLNDSAESTNWTNIVGVLGIIGDDRAIEPLIAFFTRGANEEVSDDEYQAKSSVPIALGYLYYKSHNETALSYLIDSLDPEMWEKRDLTWISPYDAAPIERNVQLAITSIMGLGLTGAPSAAVSLNVLLEPAESEADKQFRTRVSDVVKEALEANEIIANEGMLEYYRRSRIGFAK